MKKNISKAEYAANFFAEHPAVNLLWCNPKGEFFTDINYANNSLEKDENGKFDILELIERNPTPPVAAQDLAAVAALVQNVTAPEVVGGLIDGKPAAIVNEKKSEIDHTGPVVKVATTRKVGKTQQGVNPQITEGVKPLNNLEVKNELPKGVKTDGSLSK